MLIFVSCIQPLDKRFRVRHWNNQFSEELEEPFMIPFESAVSGAFSNYLSSSTYYLHGHIKLCFSTVKKGITGWCNSPRQWNLLIFSLLTTRTIATNLRDCNQRSRRLPHYDRWHYYIVTLLVVIRNVILCQIVSSTVLVISLLKSLLYLKIDIWWRLLREGNESVMLLECLTVWHNFDILDNHRHSRENIIHVSRDPISSKRIYSCP